MALYSRYSVQTLLGNHKNQYDTFVKKMGNWEEQVKKMSRSVQDIWSREKNSLKVKMNEFEKAYQLLLGQYGQKESVTESEIEQARRLLTRQLDTLRQAYMHSTSFLRRADRDAHRKEEEAEKLKAKSDRYAGISLGGGSAAKPSVKKGTNLGRYGGLSI